MKLIPFSAQYLRLDEALPFGVRDATGRLLLAAGQQVQGEGRLSELKRQPLFADEVEAADWNRRLGAAVAAAMRQATSLKAVAAARPDSTPGARESATPQQSWPELWHELVTQLEVALRDVRPDTEWRSRLATVHGRSRATFQRRPDASLYCLVHESIQSTSRYSCRHALLVQGLCEMAAAILGWPQDWIDSVGRAALTMNVGMLRLQDQLAGSKLPPTASMRTEIEVHPKIGATLLESGGMDDALCLEAVRLHHDQIESTLPLAERPPGHQLGELLRRVDIYTAQISRRGSREPIAPAQAMREACLAAGGRPDEIAGALLKAIGLYPPGSFVELVGGELAIVLARGASANQPKVAILVAASGLPLAEPVPRETADKRFAVKGGVAPALVRVRPAHDKLLNLR